MITALQLALSKRCRQLYLLKLSDSETWVGGGKYSDPKQWKKWNQTRHGTVDILCDCFVCTTQCGRNDLQEYLSCWLEMLHLKLRAFRTHFLWWNAHFFNSANQKHEEDRFQKVSSNLRDRQTFSCTCLKETYDSIQLCWSPAFSMYQKKYLFNFPCGVRNEPRCENQDQRKVKTFALTFTIYVLSAQILDIAAWDKRESRTKFLTVLLNVTKAFFAKLEFQKKKKQLIFLHRAKSAWQSQLLTCSECRGGIVTNMCWFPGSFQELQRSLWCMSANFCLHLALSNHTWQRNIPSKVCLRFAFSGLAI